VPKASDLKRKHKVDCNPHPRQREEFTEKGPVHIQLVLMSAWHLCGRELRNFLQCMSQGTLL